ncbi:LysM peptidoglycan-binding domain-containing protein [Flavobacterium sp. XS2P12]|uniref:LysM peptidoglycan-binding domain-containing protein n=1 Tax=Flavobacterium melibiosi TaxID=3398734 RepID=UPI003A85AB7B
MKNKISSKQLFFVLLLHFLNISSSIGQTVNTNGKTDFSIHEVKPKETIYSVSNMFNISADELIELNPELKKEGIQLGMSLKVPVANKEGANQVKKETFNKVLDVSSSVNSQNQNTQSSFIGELNPSIQIAKVNSETEILDFDKGIMILYSVESSNTLKRGTIAISLVDLSSKQFGKISVKQKLYIPINLGIEWNERKTYNLSTFNYKVIDFGSYLVFIDYENMKISSFEAGTNPPISVVFDKNYYRPTKQVFSNEKGEFIIEYEGYVGNKKIFQKFNKSGEQTDIIKKNKNFIPVCSYYRGIGGQRTYIEQNPDCAFNNTILHAYARLPILFDSMGKNLSEKIRENENTAFIQFYKGYYRDSERDNSFVYTYNFVFDKERIHTAFISSDLKHILINNTFIYSLPEIEITQ